MPRNVRLDATAIWRTARSADKARVKAFARGLHTHDGQPLEWPKLSDGSLGLPPVSDVRVRYAIFALAFDISNRVFDYAGRERPPPNLTPEQRRTWVGSKPPPPERPPGKQPVTSVVTDGSAVHTTGVAFVPKTARQQPSGDEAADDADADADCEDDDAADTDDGGGGDDYCASAELLVRRWCDPRGTLRVATARQLHMVWSAGRRHVVGIDPGPYGWRTHARLRRRGMVSVEMSQRQRARCAGFVSRASRLAEARRRELADAQGKKTQPSS